MFDPVDDGTTEDDFFDPTDPNRRLGPSSTCHPGFNWSCVGDTDEPFQVENICNAQTQPTPGDQGSLGTGTWVRSKVDLSDLRGRRIKVRFLVSGIKASAEVHDDQFDSINPGPGDDGWWIDNVTIDETLTSWYPTHDITFQWTIVSEGLHDSASATVTARAKLAFGQKRPMTLRQGTSTHSPFLKTRPGAPWPFTYALLHRSGRTLRRDCLRAVGLSAGISRHDDMKQVQRRIVFFGLVHCMIEGCIRMFGKICAKQNIKVNRHKAIGFPSGKWLKLTYLMVDSD